MKQLGQEVESGGNRGWGQEVESSGNRGWSQEVESSGNRGWGQEVECSDNRGWGQEVESSGNRGWGQEVECSDNRGWGQEVECSDYIHIANLVHHTPNRSCTSIELVQYMFQCGLRLLTHTLAHILQLVSYPDRSICVGAILSRRKRQS